MQSVYITRQSGPKQPPLQTDCSECSALNLLIFDTVVSALSMTYSLYQGPYKRIYLCQLQHDDQETCFPLNRLYIALIMPFGGAYTTSSGVIPVEHAHNNYWLAIAYSYERPLTRKMITFTLTTSEIQLKVLSFSSIYRSQASNTAAIEYKPEFKALLGNQIQTEKKWADL